MKFSALAVLTVTIALLSGCASETPSRPDWIDGNSIKYSSSQYLLGRGQASTQEEAKDRARADLAKIFQVAVSVSSEDIQRSKSDSTGKVQYEAQSSRNISTHTDQIVSGIQIPELWQDPVTKNYYALAVLPRLQTAASLRQQISQLDDAVGNYISQSRNTSDLFLKISAANQALEMERIRESLQKSLQVVDITGRASEPQWNSAKLESDLDDLLKRVKIASSVTPDSVAGLSDIVSGGLAKAGFLIETGQTPDFRLLARLALDDLGFQEGWYWQRGVLEVTLTETSDSRVRGTKRWTIKSNAPDRETAVKRALNQADTILKQELRGVVIDMATSH